MIADGCAVVLATGGTVPAAAMPLLRAAAAVYRAGDAVPGFDPAPPVAEVLDRAVRQPVVVVADSLDEPAAAALREAGAAVPAAPGAQLVAAAAVMDRLRSPGGCPWDAEQTHDSLRQYLIEETYELLEAIEERDRDALREELGDVLLQVLFHARVAAEDPDDPFGIDEVAGDLVRKLVGRHPHVFGAGALSGAAAADGMVRDAASQQQRWEELKQVEKRRESVIDGVAFGQPAIALAAKLVQRARRAGFPADLLPGQPLFAEVARTKLAGTDPEGALRAVCRRFADDLRAAERAARDAGVPAGAMDEQAWRKFFP